MEKYETTLDVYRDSTFVDKYAERWVSAPPTAQLDRFLRCLPDGARVLDLGCGPGHHVAYMNTLGFRAVGVDQSPEMIRMARLLFPTMRFHVANWFDAAFEPAEYDGIWACASIVHLPGSVVPRLLRRLALATRTGGLLGMTVSTNKEAHWSPDGRFFFSLPRGVALTRMLARAGFAEIYAVDLETRETTVGAGQVGLWTEILARRETRLRGGELSVAVRSPSAARPVRRMVLEREG